MYNDCGVSHNFQLAALSAVSVGMKFNDDYFVESAGKKEKESMQSKVMLGNLHNFCIAFSSKLAPMHNTKEQDVSTTKCHYRRVMYQPQLTSWA